ncbi:2-dehydropantoate 2-reductase [bacterium LRH843]|nr:2-dehydropantoate 2-reductase [bacterium LRH843]
MRVVVIGAGSIGMLTAFYLSKSGHETIVWTRRTEQAAFINEQGLKLVEQNGEIQATTVFAKPISAVTDKEDIDVAIIAVKSHQVEQVLREINHVSLRSVLFVQNGMGHLNLFPMLSIPEISVAVVEHGAIQMNDFTVRHTGVGRLRWSLVKESKDYIRTMFAQMGNPLFPVSFEENWLNMLQNKLVLNACINPLTAMLHVKNGELLESEHYLQMMRIVFDEIVNILQLENGEEKWGHVCEVCKKTAQNHSSMLVDIEQNRQTEIDSILGYLIKEANEKKFQAEVLKLLYHGIKSKENKSHSS